MNCRKYVGQTIDGAHFNNVFMNRTNNFILSAKLEALVCNESFGKIAGSRKITKKIVKVAFHNFCEISINIHSILNRT